MRNLSECSVLLVDDSEDNLDLLVEALENEYTPLVAMDGQSALEIVAESLPDLILLDIMMPDIDGYEVCRRLKADPRTKNIPVIFVTAMGQVEDELMGFELGAVDYITKPISPPVVKARVKTHLSLRLAREQLEAQNRELLEAARLREDVESITRHDLKGPLNGIIGLPSVLMGDERVLPEHRELLAMIEESGRQMLHMINQSLDIFKMERGTYQLRPVPVDLLTTARKIQNETKGLADRSNLNLLIELNEHPPGPEDTFWVMGEELLCYSLMSNLINNAIEASPEGETVIVALTGTKDPFFRIQNQGAVPAEIRSRFFDKFVTAGKKGGTGLGTYSARLMTEVQGGTISMESSESNGTIITIHLPPALAVNMVSSTEGGGVRADFDPTAFSTCSVLIVDDDLQFLGAVEKFLEGTPINVDFAFDGPNALEKLTENHYDLAFIDSELPGIDGLETAQRFRLRIKEQGRKSIPLILLAGQVRESLEPHMVEANFSAMLNKPVSRAEFLNTILMASRGTLTLETS